MRAAVIREKDGVPEAGDIPDPEASGSGVIVDVALAGLNPVDLVIAKGLMPARVRGYPAVAGLEGIGETDDGRRVYFDDPVAPSGSMAEQALVEEDSIIDVPEGLDDGLALAFGIAGQAAWLSLEWRAKLQEGETVLVLGSSGVLGQIAVQAAKLLGAGTVIAASRKEADLDRSKSLGADQTVLLADPNGLADRFRDAAGDGGIDVIIDPLWGEPAMAALEAIARFGRHVQIGNSAGLSVDFATRAFRNQLVSLMGHTNFHTPQDIKADAYRRMCEHGAAGELTVDFEVVPLDEIADAWSRQASGPHHKLVIKP